MQQQSYRQRHQDEGSDFLFALFWKMWGKLKISYYLCISEQFLLRAKNNVDSMRFVRITKSLDARRVIYVALVSKTLTPLKVWEHLWTILLKPIDTFAYNQFKVQNLFRAYSRKIKVILVGDYYLVKLLNINNRLAMENWFLSAWYSSSSILFVVQGSPI